MRTAVRWSDPGFAHGPSIAGKPIWCIYSLVSNNMHSSVTQVYNVSHCLPSKWVNIRLLYRNAISLWWSPLIWRRGSLPVKPQPRCCGTLVQASFQQIVYLTFCKNIWMFSAEIIKKNLKWVQLSALKINIKPHDIWAHDIRLKGKLFFLWDNRYNKKLVNFRNRFLD